MLMIPNLLKRRAEADNFIYWITLQSIASYDVTIINSNIGVCHHSLLSLVVISCIGYSFFKLPSNYGEVKSMKLNHYESV